MSNWKSQTAVANGQDYDTTLTTEFEGDLTNATILTPTTGTKLAIKGVFINTSASTGEVHLTIGNNTVLTIFANAQPGYVPVNVTGAVNVPLKLTSVLGGVNTYVSVNYREE